jgi:hypothetical protein
MMIALTLLEKTLLFAKGLAALQVYGEVQRQGRLHLYNYCEQK